jgi:predicted amidohydrolase
MKISLIQTDIAWNDPKQNILRCATLAQAALAEGGELLIFPEMFTSGFSMPTGDLARTSAELGLQFLSQLARDNQVYTVASLPEVASDGSLFNTLWVCAPNGNRTSYRKVHLFSYGDETKLYSPGSDLVSVVINGFSCSLFICYDLRFGAPFYQRAAETDLFIVVANWPASRREHWLTLLRARAIENQAFVVGVNRVGEGGGLLYSGDSALYAPDGTESVRLGATPGVATATIDQATVSEWRKSFPALRDRRPDLYGK